MPNALRGQRCSPYLLYAVRMWTLLMPELMRLDMSRSISLGAEDLVGTQGAEGVGWQGSRSPVQRARAGHWVWYLAQVAAHICFGALRAARALRGCRCSRNSSRRHCFRCKKGAIHQHAAHESGQQHCMGG